LARKKAFVEPLETKFSREFSMEVNGFEINRGDIIKISGEYGLKFKFDAIVTNKETGSKWVDCFEIHRGMSHSYRSFDMGRVKRIPQKGKRGVRKNTAQVVSN
jgi:hypothetical protein